MCVCVCVCERGRHGHTTVACVQTHTSFITVSVMRLRSPLGLELMVKLRTLLTVFTLILKDEDAIHFRRGLWCSVQSQCTVPVGQSEQTVLVGKRTFLENEAFERGLQRTYIIVQYLINCIVLYIIVQYLTNNVFLER